MDKIIYGGDSETVRGKPNSFQFYSEDIACNDIIFVNESNALQKFIDWCNKRKRGMQHVIYVHNLAFDLIEFFWGCHEKLVAGNASDRRSGRTGNHSQNTYSTGQSGDFAFTVRGWSVHGVYGTPTFCRMSRGKDLSITIIDSFSYFRGSLAQAAQLYCPGLPKLSRPSQLGERRYTAKDNAFCAYAMRDAEIDYHIGLAVQELHNEFDLTQCVSIADMASRIFRHKYLGYTIPQPTDDIIAASLDSYHGGKNGFYTDAGWYESVNSLDISSAYPAAMREMPAFSNASLYRRYKARSVGSVPEYGVFCVSGVVAPCTYGVLFGHDFKRLSGRVADVHVQGFELNESLRSGEFRPSKIVGWYYDQDKDHQAPALRGFVDEFYRRKRDETNKVRRTGYKFILNSISGKFIQTRKGTLRAYVDVDRGTVSEAAELIAGGMFHPFIASAITSETRARIHRLEHKYHALHTATDGIFTQRAVLQAKRAADRDVCVSPEGLGALVHEHTGELLAVRNKCYVLYSKGSALQPSRVFAGKRIAKYALHGFQGNVSDLERLAASGRRRYSYMHVNRLKESVRRDLTPNEFIKREGTLKVGPIVLKKRKRK